MSLDNSRERVPYNQIDHSHCWTGANPPCGQKIEHLKCCLCEKLNPKVHQELQKARLEGQKSGVKMVNTVLYVVDEEKEGDISEHSLSEMFGTKLEAFWYGQRQYELDSRQSIEELLLRLDTITKETV